MGIISEVKCGRCGRRYSGFRGRCPYCGARRNKRGRHADESDVTKGRLLVGVLLVVVLIAAVIVLLVSNGGSDEDKAAKKDPEITAVNEKESKSSKKDRKNNKKDDADKDKTSESDQKDNTPDTTEPDDTVVTPPVQPVEPVKPEPDLEPTPDQKIEVESLELVYAGSVMEELDFTMQVGETLSLTYRTEPEEITVAPKWESSNRDVFVVQQDGTVSAVSSGTETLTLTVGTASLECIVRVEG